MSETPVSELAIYSARPTLRVDGEEQPMMSELMLSAEVLEQEGGLSRLELRMSNWASEPDGGAQVAFENENLVGFGTQITLYAGDAEGPTEIFRGVVTGLEAELSQDGPPELVVLAEDVLQLGRMARRTAVHSDLSIADLASTVASELNLTPVVTGFSDVLGHWVQLNESDLAFLLRLLQRYDGDVQVVGDELHVSPRTDVQRGSVELEMNSQLRRLRVCADLAHQATEVTASGWDAVNGRRVSATATGVALQPGEGRLGREVLRDALGERSEHVADYQVVTDLEAQALADAMFDRCARRFVVAHGTAVGNPRIRVGTHLSLSGVSPRFDNTYYVVSARHRYDVARGYETDFEAESARLGSAQ